MKIKFFLILTLTLMANFSFSMNKKKLDALNEAPHSVTAKQDKAALEEKLTQELITAIYQISDQIDLLDKVNELLKKGANLNGTGFAPVHYSYDVLPLEAAIVNRCNIIIIGLLLRAGANPNLCSNQYTNLICKAIEFNNHVTVIELLHENGVGINSVFLDEICPTVLLHAAFVGRDDIIDYLIANGADINYKNSLGASYKEIRLDYAIEKNQFEKSIELLNKGANPNIRGKTRVLPLRLAIMHSDFPIARILIEHGANPYLKLNISDKDNRLLFETPDAKPQLVKYIKEYYAEVNAKINKRQADVKDILASILPEGINSVNKIIADYVNN